MRVLVASWAVILGCGASPLAVVAGEAPVTRAMKLASQSVPIGDPGFRIAGGDSFATATLIPSLPFEANSNTCGAGNDATPNCAFEFDTAAPDHVYRYDASIDVCVDISLCGSGYDTLLGIYENDASNQVACNDDHCGLQSRLDPLTLHAGSTYYIVVDGWSANCGEYLLKITPIDRVVAGSVFYYSPQPHPNSKPLGETEFCIDSPSPDSCALSTPSGNYKVFGAAPGPVTIRARRGDGIHDLPSLGGGDVNLLVRALAGDETLDAGQQMAGDVDRSGGPPNPADLQKLRRFLVFDFAPCPDCATWRIVCDSAGTAVDVPCHTELTGCDNVEFDFTGILLGDIDGSWPTRFVSRGDLGPVPLAFGDPVWAEDEVVVPLDASLERSPLESILFSLDYDAEALALVGATTGDAAHGFHLTLNDPGTGTLHGLLSGNRAERSGAVLELRFRSRADGTGRLSFSRLVANDVPAAPIEALELGPATGAPGSTRFHLRTAPNPFNPTLAIEYAIPAASGRVAVVLQVHDLSGRLVRRLVEGERDPGPHRLTWDGRDDDGRALASGVYLLHIRAGQWQTSRKSVLLR